MGPAMWRWGEGKDEENGICGLAVGTMQQWVSQPNVVCRVREGDVTTAGCTFAHISMSSRLISPGSARRGGTFVNVLQRSNLLENDPRRHS